MANKPSITFNLERQGFYGSLVLSDMLLSGGSGVPSLAQPPLNEPVLGTPSSGSAQVRSDQQQTDVIPGKVWSGWYLKVSQLLGTQAQGGNNLVTVMAPSIDETNLLYVTLNIALPAGGGTAPIKVNPSSPAGFQTGDYIVALNPLGFEIIQIADATGNSWTLQRQPQGAATSVSQFGSKSVAQPLGTKFYKVTMGTWRFNLNAADGYVTKVFDWPNMCVLAVTVTPRGGDPVTLNLTPNPTVVNVPGFRTLSGAEYLLTIGGAFTVGQVADYRVRVADWHSIRNLVGRLNTNPAGATPTTFSLVYISSDETQAAVVANLSIAPGHRTTYSTDPTNSRFPAEVAAWPPNVLTKLTSPFNGSGVLQLPLTPGTDPITIAEDGFFDLIVTAAGGTDLIMAVQT